MKRGRAPLITVVAGLTVALAWPAYAYLSATDQASLDVASATLQPPIVTADAALTTITLHVTPPVSGPTPTAFRVVRTTGGTNNELCYPLPEAGGDCVDSGRPVASTQSYRIEALLGTHWIASGTRDFSTKPPTPTSLTLTTGSDTGLKGDGIARSQRPSFLLRAPRAASSYLISVARTDSPERVLSTVSVAPGSGTQSFTISTPIAGQFAFASPSTRYPIEARATFGGSTSTKAFTPSAGLGVWGPPSVTDVLLTDGGGAVGTAEEADTVTVRFSQPLLPSSVCPNWSDEIDAAGARDSNFTSGISVTLADGVATPDSLTAVAPSDVCDDGLASVIHLGTVGLAGNYVDAGSVTFGEGSIELDDTWTELTITLGAITDGADNLAEVAADPGVATLSPTSPKPQDQAGNSFTTTPQGGGTPSRF